jgi:SAM-dependent methyltransferase
VDRATRRFWDRRAREDAFFFVDSRLDYGEPDLDRFWAEGERAVDDLLGRLGVELAESDDVVEIGCGVGRLTRTIAARARSVRAIDVSPRMLELAREHNPGLDGVDWIAGDGVSLAPLADASADACVSHVVFQHIPDPEITYGYVREIGRVLRPGGWAAFQVSNDPSVHRHRGLASARAALAGLAGRGPRGWTRRRYRGSAVDLEELRAAAAAGGLAIERVDGAGTQYCFVLARRLPAAG